MRRQRGSATISYRKPFFILFRAIAIATLAILPQGSAWAEWEVAPPGSPAPGWGIFGSTTLQSRGLETASQWNRVLDRLPELSEALAACAADTARCTAPWMTQAIVAGRGEIEIEGQSWSIRGSDLPAGTEVKVVGIAETVRVAELRHAGAGAGGLENGAPVQVVGLEFALEVEKA